MPEASWTLATGRARRLMFHYEREAYVLCGPQALRTAS